jgi:hypothetical protein
VIGLRTLLNLRRKPVSLPAPTHRRLEPTYPLAEMSPAAQREFWRKPPLLQRKGPL